MRVQISFFVQQQIEGELQVSTFDTLRRISGYLSGGFPTRFVGWPKLKFKNFCCVIFWKYFGLLNVLKEK